MPSIFKCQVRLYGAYIDKQMSNRPLCTYRVHELCKLGEVVPPARMDHLYLFNC